MIPSRLPRWLHAKVSGQPDGNHLAKRPLFYATSTHFVSGSVTDSRLPVVYGGAQRFTVIGAVAKEEKPPAFGGDDYRFFVITHEDNIGCSGSTCRSCGWTMRAPKMNEWRRAHLKEGGCAQDLVAAYKLLLRDMRCVICDGITPDQKFGVPLHKACVFLWLHHNAQPKALTQALILVRVAKERTKC